jgi:putative membrane protein
MLSTLLATHHWDGPPWFVFPLFWLVPLTIGLLLWRFGPWRRRAPFVDPRTHLATRYANGDIDESEYHRRLDVLEGRAR